MVDVVDTSTVIEEEERRAARRAGARVSAGAAISLLLAILILPALFRPKAVEKLPFDSQLLADVNAVAPDYVFIGNSMLGSRIDLGVLRERFGEKCCYLLWTGGAESAWMHQALKNIALAADHKPKTIFVFFRDLYLTQPSYRATDRYWWRIERLSHDSEPALTESMRRSRTWQEQLEYDLARVYPLQKARERADGAISWLAGEVATPGRMPFGTPSGGRYESLFALERLRSVEADDTAFEDSSPGDFDFEGRVDASLLPSMLRMAREHGVKLVFVRVQRRPTASGPPPQPPALTEYIGHLKAYVQKGGAQFYDFTGDPELTLDHYHDGDHISAAWKPESTRLFLRRLQKYFQ